MGSVPLLELVDLTVSVGGKDVLKGVSLFVQPGETHVLLGPNGSGKSSLLAAVMGLPPWQITGGEVRFDGTTVNDLGLQERAKLGIGMAFQRPPSLSGLSISRFAEALGASAKLTEEAAALDLVSFLDRDMNVGFSGGEIKRWEVLKLILQDPRLMLFDEPESGVDLEHVIAIGRAIDRAVTRADAAGSARAGLVITHTGLILNHVAAAQGHIMKDGRILHTGEPTALFAHIQRNGYSIPDAA
ncbi:MAG: ATP-binding cassette domain-containing protein [Pseudomonadota bacterium]